MSALDRTLVDVLIGTARPIETRTLEVQGESLAEIREQLDAQTPPGFILTDVGTFRRRDGSRTVEADTMEQLRAKIPDGWQLITVRAL